MWVHDRCPHTYDCHLQIQSTTFSANCYGVNVNVDTVFVFTADSVNGIV